MNQIKMHSLGDFDFSGKRVLLRLDINSPIDPVTKKIKSQNRILKSLPTLKKLLAAKAKIAIVAHQGDTLDYENLIPMAEHAERLSALLGTEVAYLDDVCGPAAQAAVDSLREGGVVLLGNLRYLSEEISTFETVVRLSPQQMTKTYLVRSLAPHFDFYVNDAFSAAHRNCPSMVAFQEVLPSAAGELLFQEYSVLKGLLTEVRRPCVFVLGGAKISDAFGMMRQVLENGTADRILTCGVTGVIFLMAQGVRVSGAYERWLSDRKLLEFLPAAKEYSAKYGGRILVPLDLAYQEDGARHESGSGDLPIGECMYFDIGRKTIELYEKEIREAGTVFVNGPAGVYENPLFGAGTERIWKAVAEADGYTVIGGGDTVCAAEKYIDQADIGYVCTGGGAMVRFLSGKKLPLIEAMERAYEREIRA